MEAEEDFDLLWAQELAHMPDGVRMKPDTRRHCFPRGLLRQQTGSGSLPEAAVALAVVEDVPKWLAASLTREATAKITRPCVGAAPGESPPLRSLRRMNSFHAATSCGPLAAGLGASLRFFHAATDWRVTPRTAASST